MEYRCGSFIGDILGIILMLNHMWLAILILCCFDVIMLMIISEKHEFVFGILIGLFAGVLLIVIMDYFGVDNKSSGIVPLLILDVCSIVHARS
jgi:hypothetical protein